MISASEMRQKYSLPIIGMEPALLPAARKYPSGRILVCATKTTVRGEKLRDLIETSHSAPELKAMPKLVEFAEHGTFGGPEVSEYLRRRIGSKDYDAVVLGCTHFIYFREAFAEHFGGKADIIDGNRGTVNRLVSLLPPERIREDEGKQGKVTFYTSASDDVKEADGKSRERFSELLGTCLGRPADDR